MAELVNYFRLQFPGDKSSDREVLLRYANERGEDWLRTNYPADYDEFLKSQDSYIPLSRTEEFKRGAAQAFEGTKGTVKGLGAMVTGKLGFEETSKDLLKGAQENYQRASAPELRTSHSHRWANLAGQAAPSLAESVGMGLAGAAVGGMIAPGPTPDDVVTVPAGFIKGFTSRKAMRELIESKIKKDLKDEMGDKATEAIARKRIAEALGDGAEGTLLKQYKRMGFGPDQLSQARKLYYQQGAGALVGAANSIGLNAGEIYSELATDPDIDNDTAFNHALLGGIVAGVPDSILPTVVIGKVLKSVRGVDVPLEAKSGIYSKITNSVPGKIASGIAAGAPIEAGTEAFQSWVGIVAGKSAKGMDLGEAIDSSGWSDLTYEEKKNIKHSMEVGLAAGILAGGGGSTFGAIMDKVNADRTQEVNRVQEAAVQETLNKIDKETVANTLTGKLTQEQKDDIENLVKEELLDTIITDDEGVVVSFDQPNADIAGRINQITLTTSETFDPAVVAYYTESRKAAREHFLGRKMATEKVEVQADPITQDELVEELDQSGAVVELLNQLDLPMDSLEVSEDGEGGALVDPVKAADFQPVREEGGEAEVVEAKDVLEAVKPEKIFRPGAEVEKPPVEENYKNAVAPMKPEQRREQVKRMIDARITELEKEIEDRNAKVEKGFDNSKELAQLEGLDPDSEEYNRRMELALGAREYAITYSVDGKDVVETLTVPSDVDQMQQVDARLNEILEENPDSNPRAREVASTLKNAYIMQTNKLGLQLEELRRLSAGEIDTVSGVPVMMLDWQQMPAVFEDRSMEGNESDLVYPAFYDVSETGKVATDRLNEAIAKAPKDNFEELGTILTNKARVSKHHNKSVSYRMVVLENKSRADEDDHKIVIVPISTASTSKAKKGATRFKVFAPSKERVARSQAYQKDLSEIMENYSVIGSMKLAVPVRASKELRESTLRYNLTKSEYNTLRDTLIRTRNRQAEAIDIAPFTATTQAGVTNEIVADEGAQYVSMAEGSQTAVSRSGLRSEAGVQEREFAEDTDTIVSASTEDLPSSESLAESIKSVQAEIVSIIDNVVVDDDTPDLGFNMALWVAETVENLLADQTGSMSDGDLINAIYSPSQLAESGTSAEERRELKDGNVAVIAAKLKKQIYEVREGIEEAVPGADQQDTADAAGAGGTGQSGGVSGEDGSSQGDAAAGAIRVANHFSKAELEPSEGGSSTEYTNSLVEVNRAVVPHSTYAVDHNAKADEQAKTAVEEAERQAELADEEALKPRSEREAAIRAALDDLFAKRPELSDNNKVQLVRGGDGPVFKIGDFSYSLKDIENLKDPDNTLVQFARALDGMRSPDPQSSFEYIKNDDDPDEYSGISDELDRPGATLLPGTVKEKREINLIAQEFILAAQKGFLSESEVVDRVLDVESSGGPLPSYFNELVRRPDTLIDDKYFSLEPTERYRKKDMGRLPYLLPNVNGPKLTVENFFVDEVTGERVDMSNPIDSLRASDLGRKLYKISRDEEGRTRLAIALSHEANQINKDRSSSLKALAYKLGDKVDLPTLIAEGSPDPSDAEFSPTEAAMIILMATRFNVNPGTGRTTRITDSNRVPVMDINMDGLLFIRNHLREGKKAKDAFVQGINDMTAKQKADNIREGKQGWVVYSGRESADELSKACAGTPWCIRANNTASNYLAEGDFHIYFENGQAEVAIRLERGKIGEPPRGRNSNQSLPQSYMGIAEARLLSEKIPGAEDFISDRKFEKAVIKLSQTGEADDILYEYTSGGLLYNLGSGEIETRTKDFSGIRRRMRDGGESFFSEEVESFLSKNLPAREGNAKPAKLSKPLVVSGSVNDSNPVIDLSFLEEIGEGGDLIIYFEGNIRAGNINAETDEDITIDLSRLKSIKGSVNINGIGAGSSGDLKINAPLLGEVEADSFDIKDAVFIAPKLNRISTDVDFRFQGVSFEGSNLEEIQAFGDDVVIRDSTIKTGRDSHVLRLSTTDGVDMTRSATDAELVVDAGRSVTLDEVQIEALRRLGGSDVIDLMNVTARNDKAVTSLDVRGNMEDPDDGAVLNVRNSKLGPIHHTRDSLVRDAATDFVWAILYNLDNQGLSSLNNEHNRNLASKEGARDADFKIDLTSTDPIDLTWAGDNVDRVTVRGEMASTGELGYGGGTINIKAPSYVSYFRAETANDIVVEGMERASEIRIDPPLPYGDLTTNKINPALYDIKGEEKISTQVVFKDTKKASEITSIGGSLSMPNLEQVDGVTFQNNNPVKQIEGPQRDLTQLEKIGAYFTGLRLKGMVDLPAGSVMGGDLSEGFRHLMEGSATYYANETGRNAAAEELKKTGERPKAELSLPKLTSKALGEHVYGGGRLRLDALTTKEEFDIYREQEVPSIKIHTGLTVSLSPDVELSLPKDVLENADATIVYNPTTVSTRASGDIVQDSVVRSGDSRHAKSFENMDVVDSESGKPLSMGDIYRIHYAFHENMAELFSFKSSAESDRFLRRNFDRTKFSARERNELTGGKELPPGLPPLPPEIIYSRTGTGAWEARLARDGSESWIELNLDVIEAQDVEAKVDHELGHAAWGNETREAFEELWNSMTETQRNDISTTVNKLYNEDQGVEEERVRALEEIRRIAQQNEQSASAWQKFVEFIKRIYRRITGQEHKEPEQIAASLVAFGERQITGKSPSVKALDAESGGRSITTSLADKFDTDAESIAYYRDAMRGGDQFLTATHALDWANSLLNNDYYSDIIELLKSSSFVTENTRFGIEVNKDEKFAGWQVDESDGDGGVGSNSVTVNLRQIEDDRALARTIVHEFSHSILGRTIENYERGDSALLSEEATRSLKRLERLLMRARKEVDKNAGKSGAWRDIYGLKNLDEFVAEVTSAEDDLFNILNKMEGLSQGETFYESVKLQIVDLFKGILKTMRRTFGYEDRFGEFTLEGTAFEEAVYDTLFLYGRAANGKEASRVPILDQRAMSRSLEFGDDLGRLRLGNPTKYKTTSISTDPTVSADTDLDRQSALKQNFASWGHVDSVMKSMFDKFKSDKLNQRELEYGAFVRQMGRLAKSPDEMLKLINQRLVDIGEQTVNVSIDDLTSKDRAMRDAYSLLLRAYTNIQRNRIKAEHSIDKQQESVNTSNKELTELIENYDDAKVLAKAAEKELRNFINVLDLQKSKGPEAGLIGAMLRAFPNMNNYGKSVDAVARRLTKPAKGEEEASQVMLLTLMEEIAKSGVDLNAQGLADTVKLLIENRRSEPGASQEDRYDIARALEMIAPGDANQQHAALALMAAFARRNSHFFGLAALRKDADRGKANEIIKVAMDPDKDAGQRARGMLKFNKRYAKHVERVLTKLNKHKREHRKKMRGLKISREFVDFDNSTRPVLLAAMADLESKLGVEQGPKSTVTQKSLWVASEGAEYLVPTSPEQTSEMLSKETPKMFTYIPEDATKARGEMAADLERMYLWLNAPGRVKDKTYNFVKRTYEGLSNELNIGEYEAARRSAVLKVIGTFQDKINKTGSPILKGIGTMISKFAGLSKRHTMLEPISHQWALAERDAITAVYKGREGAKELFRKNVYNPALAYFENNQQLLDGSESVEEAKRKAFQDIRKMLSTDTEVGLAIRSDDEAWAAIENLLNKTGEMSSALLEQKQEMGLLVLDDRGAAPYFRKAVGAELFTVSRQISAPIASVAAEMGKMGNGWRRMRTRRDGSQAMGNNSPVEVRDSITQALLDGRDDEVRAQLIRQNKGNVWTQFLGPLALKQGESVFSEAQYVGTEGSEFQMMAARSDVQEAYEAAADGDMLAFADNLYAATGGDVNDAAKRATYVGEVAHTLQSIFNTLYTNLDYTADPKQIRETGDGMNRVMLDARAAEGFPSEWVDYMTFEEQQVLSIVRTFALQASFGQKLEGLERDLKAAEDDFQKQVNFLESIQELTPKQQRAAAEKEYGKGGYRIILGARTNMGLANDLGKAVKMMVRNEAASTPAEMGSAYEVLQALTGVVVQSFKTALVDTSSMFVMPFSKYGLNRVGSSQALKGLNMFKQAFGSLFQAFGRQMDLDGGWQKEYTRANLGDMDTMVGGMDRIHSAMHREIIGTEEYDLSGNPVTSGAFNRLRRGTKRFVVKSSRVVREMLGTGIMGAGSMDSDVKYATLKPQAIFTQVGQWMHAANVINTWKAYNELVIKAADHLDSNPANNVEKGYRLDHKSVGYPKEAFEYMVNKLAEYGMSLETLAQGFRRNRDRQHPFTDQQLRNLSVMAQAEITKETSIKSRPTFVYTSEAGRLTNPLMGWSVAKTADVVSDFRAFDKSGEFSYRLLLQSLMPYTAIIPMSLAFVWMRERWEEKALRKKANVLQLKDAWTEDGFSAGQFSVALMDRLNRVGTFGIAGDAINSAINPATGRDFRIENRVFLISMIMGTGETLAYWVRSGMPVDYQNFVRPAIQTAGGSGYLEAYQVVNTLGDLDNQEARVTNRLNIENWVRVAGRGQGLDIRKPIGIRGVPNASKPHFKNMAIAALSNDSAMFEKSRSAAEAVLREAGKSEEEIEDKIKEAFRYNHPARKVFNALPTKAEFDSLIQAIPSEYRSDIVRALDLYNEYGKRVGVTPWEGKAEPSSGGGSSRRSSSSSIREQILRKMGGSGRSSGPRSMEDIRRSMMRRSMSGY